MAREISKSCLRSRSTDICRGREEDGEVRAPGGEGVEGAGDERDPGRDDGLFASSWAGAGWLVENPLGLPTEREVHVMQQGLPVYRLLLVRR